MTEDKKIKKCPVSLQPDIENLLQDLTPDDFASASRQEKDDFIQDRQSVSYWKDAWRRLKKNAVAMVALGVIVFLFLFAFVGPLLIPYGYDEFNKGAENLYPYHYTLEDQQRVNDEIAARTQSDVVDVDEMIAQAKAEAEKKGEVQTAVCPSHYMGLIEMYRTTGEKKYLDLAHKAIVLRDSVKEGMERLSDNDKGIVTFICG